MTKINSGLSNLLMSLFEILVGILLFINPIGFTSGIIIAFGIVILIMGIVKIIKYFRADIEEAAQNKNLEKGVLLTIAGLFCAFKSNWFIATFPVITVLYGVLILVTGIAKLQKSVDMMRAKQKHWEIALIGAILTLVFALLIVFNPFTTTAFLWSFIGISLIIEAVIDVLTFIFAIKS